MIVSIIVISKCMNGHPKRLCIRYNIGCLPRSCNYNYTDSEIGQKISELFDLSPAAIENRLKLRNPIYFETASYGHMGRKNRIVEKTFNQPSGEKIVLDVELFTWEKLDLVEQIKAEFNL